MREQNDLTYNGCDPEFGIAQMPQTDGFPDRQGDENVEYRSGSDQDQNCSDDGVCQAESGAAAHLPVFHVFSFPCRLPPGRTMNFDAADHDEDEDDYHEFDHCFFRFQPGFIPDRNRLSFYGLNKSLTPSRRTGTVCPSTNARNSIRAQPATERFP